jgi:hypothetical protein
VNTSLFLAILLEVLPSEANSIGIALWNKLLWPAVKSQTQTGKDEVNPLVESN